MKSWTLLIVLVVISLETVLSQVPEIHQAAAVAQFTGD